MQFSSSDVESLTAINDSKGESFPLDFNLKHVTYTIEVEINPGKYHNEHVNFNITRAFAEDRSTDLPTASELQLVTYDLMCCFCCFIFTYN